MLVSVLLLLISEEIVCRCHIVAVKCAIVYVPTKFFQISLTPYFNLANYFKTNNSADRIIPFAWFALASCKVNITFLS